MSAHVVLDLLNKLRQDEIKCEGCRDCIAFCNEQYISTIVKLYFSYVIKITLKSNIWHENV